MTGAQRWEKRVDDWQGLAERQGCRGGRGQSHGASRPPRELDLALR
jgi:hypothetical protein